MSKLSRHGTDARLLVHAGGIAVVAALAGSVWAFGVRPMRAARDGAEAARATVEQRQAVLDDQRRKRVERTLEFERLRGEIESIDFELEPIGNKNLRIAAITDLASEFGLEIDLRPPEEARERALYQVQPIPIAGRGSYSACAAFMTALVERFPDVQVTSFSIESGAVVRGDDQFRFDLAWYAARNDAVASASDEDG